ncbi:MAG: hypothetical protein OXT68_04295 [Chloroflexota bacterium]|nr:hypothetical protein [Chloroflexota bacterium]
MMFRPFAMLTTAILLLASALTGGASDIDNCCFVDRQCHSEQDWTNGYWAFQNNQCPAPASSHPATGSPPAVSAPAQIDNCCFVDRQCQSEQDWADGYWAYQRGQCAAPEQSVLSVGQADSMRRALRIEGSAEFIAQVNASLDLLKARAPDWYVYTVGGYDWILQLPRHSVVRHPQHVKVWIFSLNFPWMGNTVGFAGVLVHEACHLYQHQAGLKSGAGIGWKSGLEGERECFTLEIEVRQAINPRDPGLPGMRHRLANIDKIEYQWWH